ncbi:lyase family protein [Streptomyces sp. Je 1-332]|uniref:lyase family protein n=1 Tax=Streptomyces sp. Je 1-332 TaxID=3231270 RepID=UPI00345B1756
MSVDDSGCPDIGLLAPGRAGSPAEAATGDTAFLQALLAAEAALTRAQARVGLAPADAAAAVGAAARADRFDARAIALRARSGGNPVIPLVADLTAAVPAEAAPYVHRGATSQDIMDTAMMLVARRTLDLILADLTRTEAALARLAAEHRETVMPGRTLTQHAVPTTFGLKAAGWRSLTLDARDRVRSVRDTLPAQLGGAAGTLAAFEAYADGEGGTWAGSAGASAGASTGGAAPDHASATPSETPLPNSPSAEGCPAATPPTNSSSLAETLVAVFARELRLAEPTLPWHTLRTPVADLAGVLAFTAGALGKVAVDILTLSRTELAEVTEGAGGGSSAMPHKANPVHSTLVAAAARRAPALAATLHASMAAEDERPAGAWHAEWEPLRDLLRTVGGASHHAAELTENLRVHPEAMREHLGLTHGLIISERLTAELTPLLGRARAKELLTSAARRTRDEGRTLAEVLAEEPGLETVDLTELTDPARYTGSAGALTDRALERR